MREHRDELELSLLADVEVQNDPAEDSCAPEEYAEEGSVWPPERLDDDRWIG